MIAFINRVGSYELERTPTIITRSYKLKRNLLKHGVPRDGADWNVRVYRNEVHYGKPDETIYIRGGRVVATTTYPDTSAWETSKGIPACPR